MKIDRLLSIVMLLLERPRIQASEMATMFQVSPRTIYRDIEALGLAGLPVVTYPGAGGGIGLMEQFKLDKRLFTAADLSNLLIGLSSVQHALPGNETAQTLARLKGFISSEQAAEVELKANQVIIDPTPWGGSSRLKPLIETIKEAITKRRYLSFRYLRPNGEEQIRQIEPYCLLNKSLNWYVQGYCLLREDYRTFKLQRISELNLSAESYAPRDFTPQVFDDNQWGEGPRIQLVLRIHASLRAALEEWCGSERIEPDGAEYYLAHLDFYDSAWIYQFVLGWGSRCEVLAPEHIRKHIAEQTHAMAELYQPTTL